MLTAWQTTCVLTLLSSARQVLGITFQLPKIGGCPELEAQNNFISNMDEFLDKWYVQSSFDTEILQGKARCMTATYTYLPEEYKILVATKQFNEENNQWERLNADATPANRTSEKAKFTVKFTIPIWGEVSGTYTVLGTDFNKYAVIHGCGSFFGILHYDCSWLMSKQQKMTPEEEKTFYAHAGEVLQRYGDNLKLNEYKKVDQVNCAMTE